MELAYIPRGTFAPEGLTDEEREKYNTNPAQVKLVQWIYEQLQAMGGGGSFKTSYEFPAADVVNDTTVTINSTHAEGDTYDVYVGGLLQLSSAWTRVNNVFTLVEPTTYQVVVHKFSSSQVVAPPPTEEEPDTTTPPPGPTNASVDDENNYFDFLPAE